MDARQRQILDYLFNNSKSSYADISVSVGIAVRQVHRHLAVLRAQNLVYRGGWDCFWGVDHKLGGGKQVR